MKKNEGNLKLQLGSSPFSSDGVEATMHLRFNSPGIGAYLDTASFHFEDETGRRHFSLTLLIDGWIPYISGYHFGEGEHGDEGKSLALLSLLEGTDERYYRHELADLLAMPLPQIIVGDFPAKVAGQLNIKVINNARFAGPHCIEVFFRRLRSAIAKLHSRDARLVVALEIARWNLEESSLARTASNGMVGSLAQCVNHALEIRVRSRAKKGVIYSHELAMKLLPSVDGIIVGDPSIRVFARGVSLRYLPASRPTWKWFSGPTLKAVIDPRSVNRVLVRDESKGSVMPCRLHPDHEALADMTWTEVYGSQIRRSTYVESRCPAGSYLNDLIPTACNKKSKKSNPQQTKESINEKQQKQKPEGQ